MKKNDPINKKVNLNKQVEFKEKFPKSWMLTQPVPQILDKGDQLIVCNSRNPTYLVSKKGPNYFKVYIIDFVKFLITEIEKIWEKYQNDNQ